MNWRSPEYHLPIAFENVMVLLDNNSIYIGRYNETDKSWDIINYGNEGPEFITCQEDVSAWRFLPQLVIGRYGVYENKII